jgi:hypothetical protein
MKKLWLLLPVLLLFVACEPAADDTTADDELIESLLLADTQEEVALTALPPAMQEELETNHFDTYVDFVFRVPGRGFIVQLGNGETLFCTENGRPLWFRGPFAGRGLFPHHPHGPCFRAARRFGEPVAVEDLATTITDYITANYPDAEIRRAKERAGNTLVLITGPTVLRFDETGTFVGEVDVLAHCENRCRPLGDDEAGQAVADYVTANFPDIAGRRVCRRPNRIVVFLNTGEERTVLIFDGAGNFVDQRP